MVGLEPAALGEAVVDDALLDVFHHALEVGVVEDDLGIFSYLFIH